TMLGIMFGVGAVIAMLSIGAGAAVQAQALIDQLGMRNVLVRARQLRPDEMREARKKSLGVSLGAADGTRAEGHKECVGFSGAARRGARGGGAGVGGGGPPPEDRAVAGAGRGQQDRGD